MTCDDSSIPTASLRRPATSSTRPPRVRLARGSDHDFIYVDVRRHGEKPADAVGDIFGVEQFAELSNQLSEVECTPFVWLSHDTSDHAAIYAQRSTVCRRGKRTAHVDNHCRHLIRSRKSAQKRSRAHRVEEFLFYVGDILRL